MKPSIVPRKFELNLPNQITVSRMLLSLIFFGLIIAINYGCYGIPGLFESSRRTLLNLSFAIFIGTALTDFLDGYLARKWQVVSTFGRIADPIADKVFICGSFVLLVDTSQLLSSWIPVVIISREFLISGLRSFIEARGVPFGAGFGGKLKMVFQSITIPVIIFYEANVSGSNFWKWVVILFLRATIFLTVSSSVEYIKKASALLSKKKD